MTEPTHIAELRRRVQQDPASIAFAQLAEELRRAGAYQDAVVVCRDGLIRHPAYISARVTLGRSLLQLQHLDEAAAELERVLKAAPQNLAALRALAETRLKQGDRIAAIGHYEAAHALAPNDPELERTVASLGPQVKALRDADTERDRRTIAALEQWLTAIHVSRA